MATKDLKLGVGAYDRDYPHTADIELVNRFVEGNPSNTIEQYILVSRPGTTYYNAVGEGPIRAQAYQEGLFNSAHFVVSNETLWRIDTDGTKTAINGIVGGTGSPTICFVSGLDYERLWIADGALLQYYDGTTAASGTLTLTPSTPPDIASQTVQIDDQYYQWAVSVAGAANGTSGSPWKVLVGADDEESLANMAAAINASGTAGVTYSSGLVINPDVTATSTALTLVVTAKARGSAGNLLATVVTGSHLAWGAATLEGGGVDALVGTVIPDDEAVSVCESIAGYVVFAIAGSDRCYWIEPGLTTIDALDFFTAEQEGDKIDSLIRVGDRLWIFGPSTTEVWAPTQDTDLRFRRIRGIAYSKGVIEGTALRLNQDIFLVGDDQVVYNVGNGIRRVSTHAVEEQIRLAVKAKRDNA